jgi:hypothetical protein
MQEGERGKGNQKEGRDLLECGGGRVRLYIWRRAGLADEVGSDAMPDPRGGFHAIAKPDCVIHMYPTVQ